VFTTGAKEAIPEGKNRAVVAVGFGNVNGVVKAMPIRGDQEGADPGFPSWGQADIAMIKESRGIEEDFIDHHPEDGGSQQSHHGHFPGHGQEDLKGMEAHTRGGIQDGVSMVDLVDAPQRGIDMKQDMMPIHRQIQDHNCEEHLCGKGKMQMVKKPPLAVASHGDSTQTRNQPAQQGTQGNQAQVTPPATVGMGLGIPKRGQMFP